MRRRDFLVLSAMFASGCATSQRPLQISFPETTPAVVKKPEPKKDKPSITLTIDDGPGPYTPGILDALGQENAVFFMKGRNLDHQAFFRYAIRAAAQGNTIGNHSYNHPEFSAIPYAEAVSQIVSTDALIERVYAEAGVPRTKKLFRFPYGDPGDGICGLDHAPGNQKRIDIARFLKDMGYRPVHWDIDCQDWKHYSSRDYISAGEVMANCRKAAPGDVVLCHENQLTETMVVPFFAKNRRYALSTSL